MCCWEPLTQPLKMARLSSTLSPLLPVQMSCFQLPLLTLSATGATGAAILTVIRKPRKKFSCFTPCSFYQDDEHFELHFSEAIKTLTGQVLHRPPLALQRTNLASEERQPPRALVFGGFAVRSWDDILHLGCHPCTAMLRPGAASHEPYLSASLNEYSALSTHTDRSNCGSSWTISFGDYTVTTVEVAIFGQNPSLVPDLPHVAIVRGKRSSEASS